MTIDDVFAAGPVMPVIVIQKLETAVPLAKALVAGGIRVLEVTLRTPVALDAIREMCAAVPEAIVGAGTVTTPDELQAAIKAGATFGVSPGATPALLSAIVESGLPFLPGAMTPSDVMLRREAGFKAMKLFPAQQAGGLGMLKALGACFRMCAFAPPAESMWPRRRSFWHCRTWPAWAGPGWRRRIWWLRAIGVASPNLLAPPACYADERRPPAPVAGSDVGVRCIGDACQSGGNRRRLHLRIRTSAVGRDEGRRADFHGAAGPAAQPA